MITNNRYSNTFKSSISDCLNSVFFTSYNSVSFITKLLVNPPLDLNFFQDFNKWVKNVIVYPFNLGKELSNKSYLRIGYETTSAPATYEDIEGVEFRPSEYTKTVDNMIFNIGQMYVEPKYEDFRDYNGYCILKLYLPFLGLIDLDSNICMGRWIRIRLAVNVLDGTGTYIIGVSDAGQNDNNFIYPFNSNIDDDAVLLGTYDFQLGYSLPLSSTNAGEVKRNMLINAFTTAASIGVTAATGFPTMLPSTTTSKTTVTHQTPSLVTGRMKNRYRDVTEGISTYTPGGASPEMYKKAYVNKCFDGAEYALQNSFIRISNCNSGTPSVLNNCSRDVVLYYYYPKFESVTNDYLKLYGKPLGKTRYLNAVHGYTEISAIHIEGEAFSQATSNEIAMLNEMLSSGIILP